MLKDKLFFLDFYYVIEEGIFFINGYYGFIVIFFFFIRYSVELFFKVCGYVKFDIIEREK